MLRKEESQQDFGKIVWGPRARYEEGCQHSAEGMVIQHHTQVGFHEMAPCKYKIEFARANFERGRRFY